MVYTKKMRPAFAGLNTEKAKSIGTAVMVLYAEKLVLAGTISNDRVFRKTVRESAKLHKLNAYGLDVSYMKKAYEAGIQAIELSVRETRLKYRIDVDTFKRYAVEATIGKFGPRLYCPLEHWTVTPAVPDKARLTK